MIFIFFVFSKSSCINEKISVGRSYESNSFNIFDCFFTRLHSFNGNGGVIFCSASGYSLDLERSMFFSCSSSGRGGSVYFSSSNSKILMICSNQCIAQGDAHFALILLSQNGHFNFSSINNCTYNLRDVTLWPWGGSQTLESSNISKNTCRLASSLLVHSPISFSISRFTIYGNQATQSQCIWLYANSGTISFSNIVNNNSPNGKGVIYTDSASSYTIEYCIFHGNSDSLFFSEVGSSLTIRNNYIHHSSYTDSANNNSILLVKEYPLEHFRSFYCNQFSEGLTFHIQGKNHYFSVFMIAVSSLMLS